MLETKWISNNKDYKSNTGSNYASQNYHNQLNKIFGITSIAEQFEAHWIGGDEKDENYCGRCGQRIRSEE